MTNGFFRAEQRAGRWWLVDPAGEPFISKGVTTVRYAQDRIQGTNRSPYEEANQAKYGGIAAWREAVAKRLIGWGFNTLGAWSDEALAGPHLAYAPTLDFGGEFVKEKHAGKGAWQHGIFPDVFDPGFAATARRVAEKKCAACKDDRHLLGWFTDNELRWGPDWRGKEELLTMFLALPTNAPGRVAAVVSCGTGTVTSRSSTTSGVPAMPVGPPLALHPTCRHRSHARKSGRRTRKSSAPPTRKTRVVAPLPVTAMRSWPN